MAVQQNAYAENIGKGRPGMVATMNSWDADTRTVETAAGIGFGLAVSQGTADKGALLGGASAAVFAGLSIRDVSREVGDADKYPQYASMGVLTKGVMWVTVGGDVAKGGDVTFAAATGVLSSAAVAGGQFAIAGARWMDTVSSGGLARVRLSGHLPAA